VSAQKKQPARKALSRELILEAALGIVDSDQVRELTMSKLGNALDADPSAVYRHFRNKDELLLAMADAMLEEVAADFRPVLEPLDNLRGMAWAMRNGYLRRPGLAQEVAARFTGGRAEAQLVREMLTSIEKLGFSREESIPLCRGLAEMSLGHIVMTADVLSLTNSQQAFDLQMATAYYSAPYDPAQDLPRDEQLAATRADSDAVFHTMLETFLAGLAVQQEARRAPAPRPRSTTKPTKPSKAKPTARSASTRTRTS
jgi:AcrR family transcriptional regulator